MTSTTTSARRFQSARITEFRESVIREMTRLAIQHGSVNLAQGFPDFPAPAELKAAAQKAIADDFNQYPITWGVKPFRDAICQSYKRFYNLDIDPEREVTVCCGATEGMIATLLALLNQGDEVIVFEPFYENYWPDSQLSGATIKYVSLHPPNWDFNKDELSAAFNSRTRAVIINSPNNPTGKVYSAAQLKVLGELCEEHDCLLICDEIYEHIIFDGEKHIAPITLGSLRNRTVAINSLSKTFSVTGWRVGWVIAPPELTNSIRKVHDFLTVGAATPFQYAGITALSMPDSYFQGLSGTYQFKRDHLVGILERIGFKCHVPKGAYYVMCDISPLGFTDDFALCRHLVENIGVSAVPGSSFFSNPADGKNLIRFCFAKKIETLDAAAERLSKLARG
jgi:aspartate/methionine/tyrosine aminotransferase